MEASHHRLIIDTNNKQSNDSYSESQKLYLELVKPESGILEAISDMADVQQELLIGYLEQSKSNFEKSHKADYEKEITALEKQLETCIKTGDRKLAHRYTQSIIKRETKYKNALNSAILATETSSLNKIQKEIAVALNKIKSPEGIKFEYRMGGEGGAIIVTEKNAKNAIVIIKLSSGLKTPSNILYDNLVKTATKQETDSIYQVNIKNKNLSFTMFPGRDAKSILDDCQKDGNQIFIKEGPLKNTMYDSIKTPRISNANQEKWENQALSLITQSLLDDFRASNMIPKLDKEGKLIGIETFDPLIINLDNTEARASVLKEQNAIIEEILALENQEGSDDKLKEKFTDLLLISSICNTFNGAAPLTTTKQHTPAASKDLRGKWLVKVIESYSANNKNNNDKAMLKSIKENLAAFGTIFDDNTRIHISEKNKTMGTPMNDDALVFLRQHLVSGFIVKDVFGSNKTDAQRKEAIINITRNMQTYYFNLANDFENFEKNINKDISDNKLEQRVKKSRDAESSLNELKNIIVQYKDLSKTIKAKFNANKQDILGLKTIAIDEEEKKSINR